MALDVTLTTCVTIILIILSLIVFKFSWIPNGWVRKPILTPDGEKYKNAECDEITYSLWDIFKHVYVMIFQKKHTNAFINR
jgi:hypothetical protein